jgi:hypothetical protein
LSIDPTAAEIKEDGLIDRICVWKYILIYSLGFCMFLFIYALAVQIIRVLTMYGKFSTTKNWSGCQFRYFIRAYVPLGK